MARADRPPAEAESVPLPSDWGTLPEYEWQALSFLQPFLARARRWLDLGCGTGSVTAALLARYRHATAVGIDASDVAVAHGLAQVARTGTLAGRLTLAHGDLRAPAAAGPFDLVLARFSLQFLRLPEFHALCATIGSSLLAPSGVLAGTVRSTGRSVPANYVALPEEPNTYRSGEPHEQGLIYHHYAKDEIEEAARLIGGETVHLDEIVNLRRYDPAPKRAWWNFVIVRR